MLNFIGALSRSTQQFKGVLEAELQQILKGEFEVIEGVTVDHLAKLLDMLAGIDVWHIDKVNGIRGVALRIQTGDKDWHTFTIRATRDNGVKTEFEKRSYAIEHGFLYPYLTVQAYITKDNKLVSFAVAKTKDIIDMIKTGHATMRHTGQEQIGQASFYIIDWYDMKKCGYKIAIR